MTRSLVYLLLLFVFSCGKFYCQLPVTNMYNCSGAPQTFVVPTCVTSITIEAWGAGGGGGGWDTYGGSAGGGGSYISSVLSVSPGQVLTIVTGCGGQPGGACQAGSGFGPGGYGLGYGGDGGNPGTLGCSGPGGGGGGGTGILNGGTILAVAGGGGGGGGGGNYGGGADGGGGDQNGNAALGANGGVLATSGSTNGAVGAMTNGDGAGGGGGGGGLIGGGGGSVPGTDYGGAGGAGGTSLGTTINNGNIITPGNPGGAGLCGGCASGGTGAPLGGVATAGGNGVLLLTYLNIPTPVVTANASANPVCVGNPVTLTGGGATTYTWTGGVTDGIAFTPGSTTTYTVTGSTLGCTNTAVITVTVNNLPVITVNSGTICVGQSMALIANGANTYTWSPATGLSGTTSSIVIANPSATTIYTITGTDANSCINTISSTLTVNQLPTITVNSAAICAGQQTAALTANGATSYNWSPGTGLNTTSGANVNASPASTTVYTITGSDANTCTNTITSTVTVNSIPTVTVSSGSICSGASVTLTAGGANTYNWSPATNLSSTTGPIVTANPPSLTVYTVTGTDVNTCTNIATTTVTVNSPPTVTTNSAAICIGQQTATLTANGANTYVWSPATGLSSSSGAVVTATPASTTVYTVTGTAVNGCTNSASSTVTVNPLPMVAANSSSICVGQQTATLTANGANTYAWSPATGLSSTSGGVVTANPSSTTIYTIAGTDANTCTNVATSTVTVNSLPNITVNTGVICASAGSATLTANGANTYAWSPPTGLSATTGQSVTANPPSLTVYTVTGTDLNSCTNVVTTTVTVNSVPVINVNSAVICLGQQVATLTANGANTYAWLPGTGLSSTSGTSVTSNPSSTTVYTITGTAVNGCTSTISSTVTVNPTPTVSVNSGTICFGQQTATLTANGANTYAWLPATGLSSASGSVNTANPSSTTVYTITGTDANNCTNSVTSTVVVNPLPTLSVNSASICLGQQTASLAVNGANTYTWLPATGLSSTSGSNVTANPGSTTIYTIGATDVNTCTNTITSTITVNALPTITVNSGTMCIGQQTVSLTANGANTYTWSPATGISSTSGANVTANPNTSTIYTVSGTDVSTCTTTANSTITVYSLPTITVNSASICKSQQTATLTAGGAVNYVWIPSNGLSSAMGTSVTANPGSSSTYTIVGSDANTCSNTAVSSVTVNPIPVVTVNSTTICLGQSANINANGASAYSWSPSTGLSSTSGQNVSANPVSTTIYTVEGTDVNTCTNVATSTIAVNPLPLVVVNSSLICVGQQTAVLNALGALNYTWSPGTGLSATSGNDVLASPIVTTIYTVTGEDNAHCQGTATSTVTVKPLPAPVVSPLDAAGCAPLCVNFSELSNTPGTYNWSFGDGVPGNTSAPIHCYNQGGLFTVKVSLTDVFGCKDSSSTTVTVYPKPVADFVYAPLKPHIYADDQVTFTNASYGANIVSYNWYFVTPAVILSSALNPVINYTKAGDYTCMLLVTSDHGCIDTISKPIEVNDDYNIFIPNAFTPNGDGINETFQPKGTGFSKYHMRIFDRWGELLYETDELGNGWDGTFQKKSKDVLPNDVYIYKIHLVTIYGESKDVLGHVSLIR